MVNEILLEILKRKIETNEVVIKDIKSVEYKTAIEECKQRANNEAYGNEVM